MQLMFGKISGTPEYGNTVHGRTVVRANGESPLGERTRYEGTVTADILEVHVIGENGEARISTPLASAGRGDRWLSGFFGNKQARIHSLSMKAGKPSTEDRKLLTEDVLEIRRYVESSPPEGGFKDPEPADGGCLPWLDEYPYGFGGPFGYSGSRPPFYRGPRC